MKKILLLLLIVCMVLPLLAGCDQDTDPHEEQTKEIEVDTGDPNNPNLTPINANREFIIMGRNYGDDYLFKYSEIEDTGEKDERVNQSVVSRNYLIEDKYNMEIGFIGMGQTDQIAYLSQDILSGAHEIDLVMPVLQYANNMAASGYLTEWGLIPYVDETKPYWMTHLFENTSIGGYHFYACGDLNLSAYNTVQVVFFNKNMHKDLSLPDIYSLAKEHKWTLEAMETMAATAGKDVTGDGVKTADDVYGIVSATMVWQPLLYSSGTLLVTKDANDIPTLSGITTDTDRIYALIEDIVELMNKNNTAGVTNAVPMSGKAKFGGGEALFWIECIYGQYELLEMEQDYGIVPAPLWNEGDEYTSNIHTLFTTCSAVPYDVKDLNLSGSVLEDMAYYSSVVVIPEYYEKIIHLRNLRDDESYEMLDIIYENIIVDIAMMMPQLTIDTTLRAMVEQNKTDAIASALKNNAAQWSAVINSIATGFTTQGASQYGY